MNLKRKKLKGEKGITLIALVITIIVMLILVTVTIRVATDGKLFTHAANAVKGTKTAIAGENDILNDNLDKSIENIVAEQTGEGGGDSDIAKLRAYYIDGDESEISQDEISSLYEDSSTGVGFIKYNNIFYELTIENRDNVITVTAVDPINNEVIVVEERDSSYGFPKDMMRFTPKSGPAQTWAEWAEDPTFSTIDLSLGRSDTLKSVIQGLASSSEISITRKHINGNKFMTRKLELNGQSVTAGSTIVSNSIYTM